MKAKVAVVSLALTTAACGDDGDQTHDGAEKRDIATDLMSGLEQILGRDFTPEERRCIVDTVESYDLDDLRSLRDNVASKELAEDFREKVTDCSVANTAQSDN